MTVPYSANLAVNNAWDNLRRLSPQTGWRPGNAAPDDDDLPLVHDLACNNCGEAIPDPCPVGRQIGCQFCGRGGFWVAPDSPEALAAIAAHEAAQEAGPGGRLRGRARGRR